MISALPAARPEGGTEESSSQDAEVLGDLREGDAVLAAAGHAHHVVTGLLGTGTDTATSFQAAP